MAVTNWFATGIDDAQASTCGFASPDSHGRDHVGVRYVPHRPGSQVGGASGQAEAFGHKLDVGALVGAQQIHESGRLTLERFGKDRPRLRLDGPAMLLGASLECRLGPRRKLRIKICSTSTTSDITSMISREPLLAARLAAPTASGRRGSAPTETSTSPGGNGGGAKGDRAEPEQDGRSLPECP